MGGEGAIAIFTNIKKFFFVELTCTILHPVNKRTTFILFSYAKLSIKLLTHSRLSKAK